jgi:hypothetical protein
MIHFFVLCIALSYQAYCLFEGLEGIEYPVVHDLIGSLFTAYAIGNLYKKVTTNARR